MRTKNKLDELKSKREKYILLIKKKSLELGESDGPMASQSPSGRFELEQEIEGFQIILNGINKEILELEKIKL